VKTAGNRPVKRVLRGGSSHPLEKIGRDMQTEKWSGGRAKKNIVTYDYRAPYENDS